MLAKVLFLFDLTKKKKKKKKDSGGDEVIGVVPPDLRSAPSKVFFLFFFPAGTQGSLYPEDAVSSFLAEKKKWSQPTPGPLMSPRGDEDHEHSCVCQARQQAPCGGQAPRGPRGALPRMRTAGAAPSAQ